MQNSLRIEPEPMARVPRPQKTISKIIFYGFWGPRCIVCPQGLRGGRCVVCLGTSAFEDAEACRELRAEGRVEGVRASPRVVAGHAYPVLAMRQAGM